MQHYRDWGATAAGRSPWSVIRKECIPQCHKKRMIRYFLDRFAIYSNPLTTITAASGMHGESGAYVVRDKTGVVTGGPGSVVGNEVI